MLLSAIDKKVRAGEYARAGRVADLPTVSFKA